MFLLEILRRQKPDHGKVVPAFPARDVKHICSRERQISETSLVRTCQHPHVDGREETKMPNQDPKKHPAPAPDAERKPKPFRFTDWAAI